ncbi:alpha/beta hydrolase, partial [Vibrio anguillarum]|nr:alpha/beta hydrolase [Vibrio anguillarum]
EWYWRHDPQLNSDSLYRMSYEHAQHIMAHIQCPQRVILGTQGFSELRAARGYFADDRQEMFTISGGHHCH